mmetsp:Transcript_2621/g.3580  ORF Transcript_2621/g.3580 Transcript_2621/m.3580 type:complete len:246 (-) Transcript_2621:160-897(-)
MLPELLPELTHPVLAHDGHQLPRKLVFVIFWRAVSDPRIFILAPRFILIPNRGEPPRLAVKLPLVLLELHSEGRLELGRPGGDNLSHVSFFPVTVQLSSHLHTVSHGEPDWWSMTGSMDMLPSISRSRKVRISLVSKSVPEALVHKHPLCLLASHWVVPLVLRMCVHQPILGGRVPVGVDRCMRVAGVVVNERVETVDTTYAGASDYEAKRELTNHAKPLSPPSSPAPSGIGRHGTGPNKLRGFK